MKFSNGNWLVREGFQLHSPTMVYDSHFSNGVLTLFAPCKEIYGRASTLDGPLLTIHLSSPLEGAIRVQIQHFASLHPALPQFLLACKTPPSVECTEYEDHFVYKSGDTWAHVTKKPFEVTFYYKDRKLTSSQPRAQAYVKTAQDGTFMREQLSLGVGELVYGLGEHFTAFVKNGQTVDIWNEDGGTGTEQAYKSIPFYLTNRKYGLLVNHPEKVSFEVASERVSRVQFSVAGEELDYVMIGGETEKEILERYTDLTGKPALPPAWSFGLWLTTSFTTDYNEETVSHFVDGMRTRNIPLHVFHFDCFWMKEYEWCNFDWDLDSFPDPVGMLRRLKERGLHISVWINPYIAQKSRLFNEGAQKGYLLKRPDGRVWQWDLWQAGMGLVDFTNPDACAWYQTELKRLLDMGVDCFKTDFGERVPTDVAYHDGSDPNKMHNFYAFLYNKVVFELLRDVRGGNEAVLFARSATTGGQQFPVHWGGDSSSNYESMAESLRGGLSLGLSGFGFWSHDIGGFENTSTPDVYKRWIAFGLLSSHSRLHGSSSYRVPWLFDEESVDVLRTFVNLKCSLMPYLYRTAVTASQSGIPMMRPMLLEFPEDLTCETLDRQYMLGDSLLVAPVLSEDGVVSYYLPAGRWTHFVSGQVIDGERWVTESYGYMNLPIFARPNSVIAVGSRQDRPDYNYSDNVTLHVFELEPDSSHHVEICNLSGDVETVFHIRRMGDTIDCTASKADFPYRIFLRNAASIHAVKGGSCLVEANHVLIEVVNPGQTVTISL
ncbi:MAG: alpha-xylosidase [Firmicutes bacterium]|nr:alpha-xylosidase [Bacillota bacterium]